MHYEKFADGTVKCIEDEIPFEIPENWAWCRLKSITDTIQYGLSNSAEQEGSYRLLRITDIQDGRVNWDMVPFTNIEKPEKYLLQISDIVFARTGATVGKSFLITELPYPAVYASYLIRIRIIGSIFSRYIYHFFNSQCYWVQITRKALGIGQPNCNGTSLGELFIPLPPAKEQGRVVKSADIFLESAITLENEEYALKNLIAVAKSRILDLAIRGKLVPQDPNDEPVSVLLERIRAEKEELIKQGKIKRDKKESVIFKGDDNSYYEKIGNEIRCIDEEIPFDIPDSWMWVRLENCCAKEIRRGKSPTYAAESNVLVFAQKCNTKCNGIDLLLSLHLDVGTLSRYPQDEYMLDEDIVINSTGTGTLGRVGIYRNIDNPLGIPIVPDSHVTVIRSHKVINSFYLYTYLKASQKKLEESGEGSTNQKELKPATLKELLVSLPPYAEQTRIVDSIQATLLPIETIERSLN